VRGASGSTIGAFAVSYRIIGVGVVVFPIVLVGVRVEVITGTVVPRVVARVGADVSWREERRRRKWRRKWWRKWWRRYRKGVAWTVASVLRARKSIGHVVIDAKEGVQVRRGA